MDLTILKAKHKLLFMKTLVQRGFTLIHEDGLFIHDEKAVSARKPLGTTVPQHEHLATCALQGLH